MPDVPEPSSLFGGESIEGWLRWFQANPVGATVLAFLLALAAVLAVLAMARSRRWRLWAEELLVRAEAADVNIAAMGARLEERTDKIAELEHRSALLERNLQEASSARAALTAEVAAGERSRREQAALLEKSETRLREAFGALSREALGRNNEMFLSLAKAQLGEFQKNAEAQLEAKRTAVDSLVKPIGDTLGRMGAALDAAEKNRSADHASFTAVQKTLAETTGRLVRALHHSAARGRWGELQLRRVVEMAGMLEHCDFDEQVSVGEEGRKLRPDLVIHLVGHRTIVVDAKTPMESYLKAQEAESEAEERELRLRHAKAVREHMTSLGGKAYWNQFRDTPEFVVMFFPNEAVFAEAMRIDPGLMDHGVLNQVIPASPATLIALLKAADYGWQQLRAAENARTIFDMGRQLYERFATEYRHLSVVGASLAKAVDNYNKCVGSAERKLFPYLRRFGELSEKELFPEPVPVEDAPRALADKTSGAAAEPDKRDAPPETEPS